MFKAIVLLITDTLGLSGRLKLKSYALLGIYESVGYNVTSDPPETLRYDLQLFDVHLPRKIPRTSLNQLLVLSATYPFQLQMFFTYWQPFHIDPLHEMDSLMLIYGPILPSPLWNFATISVLPFVSTLNL